MTRTRLICAAAAALVTAALPATAVAGPSIVYTHEGNVWVASADGASKRQFTSDGTVGAPSTSGEDRPRATFVGEYEHASVDDAGRVLAAREYRTADGHGFDYFWIRMAPDGSRLNTDIVAMDQCGPMQSAGPYQARMDSTGTWVAYSYYCNRSFPCCSLEPHIAVDRAAGPTTAEDPPATWSGRWLPSWYGNRIVASTMDSSQVQDNDPAAPLTPSTPLRDWLVGARHVEVARSGDFSLVQLSDPASTWQFITGNPDVEPQPRCVLTTSGAEGEASLSADGSLVTWRDTGGIKVARVPDLSNPATAGQPCVFAEPPIVIAQAGQEPVLTSYDYFPATVAPPPADNNNPTTTSATPAITPTIPARIKGTALARGAKLKLNATVPGNLTARATAHAKTAKRLGVKVKRRAKTAVVATGSLRAVAGENTVTLRLVSKARRRAARLKGASLTLTLTLKPATGAAVTVTRQIRVT
jgi:hypothetical protein